MGRIEDHGKELLIKRVDRMRRLIASSAPDAMIANECELIGDCGRLMDPEGYLKRQLERELASARIRLGLCVEPDCEELVDLGRKWCTEHDAEYAGIYEQIAEGTRL